MKKLTPYNKTDIDSDTLIELEAWQKKCLEERDKRQNPLGMMQYTLTSEKYVHFRDDPNADPNFTRAPLTDEVDVVIIGAGFAGIQAAAQLRKLGVENIRIVDAGSDFGGTWYWNQYPGVQCDIDAYCYLPLLEETGYIPQEKYSYGPEIREHSQRIGKFFDLYKNTYFQTNVTSLKWDEDSARWTVGTDRDDAMQARFVIMGLGPLSVPRLPSLQGISDFEGKTFHSARWDHHYTGGDSSGGLTKLAGKRVALIGTGASAIQCASHIAEHAEMFYVLQRTPASVDERRNRPTNPEWSETLEPGWQKERRDNFDAITSGKSVSEDLVDDLWTEDFKQLTNVFSQIDEQTLSKEEIMEREVADFNKSKNLHTRIDTTIKDQVIVERLKPWYRLFCKRPCFNDDFLPTFNRPNVRLIDTLEGKGLECATQKGLIVNGEEIELDCIIFSTGFEIGTSFASRAGFEVTGQNGLTLSKCWSRGLKTFHGCTTRGFPNLFNIAVATQNANSINITSVLGAMAEHISYIVSEVINQEARYTHPTPEAQAEWVAEITSSPLPHGEFLASCTPGYYNFEGHAKLVPHGLLYRHGFPAYVELLAAWRKNGKMHGMDLTY